MKAIIDNIAFYYSEKSECWMIRIPSKRRYVPIKKEQLRGLMVAFTLNMHEFGDAADVEDVVIDREKDLVTIRTRAMKGKKIDYSQFRKLDEWGVF